MESLSAVFLAVLVYSFVFPEAILHGVYGNATGEEATSPLQPNPAPNTNENLPLLSISNILSAARIAWNFIAFFIPYLIHLPKVVYLPMKHVTIAFVYAIEVLLRPLYPVLAPVYLAIKILVTPVFVPVLLLYRIAVLAYPLYVFLGAAVLCGAMAGLLARRLGGTIVKDVLGFRSQHTASSSKGKAVFLSRKPHAGRT